MDKSQTLLQIIDVLEVAIIQARQLIKKSENLSSIEADIIKDYLRIAYDKLNVLVYTSIPFEEENSKEGIKNDVDDKKEEFVDKKQEAIVPEIVVSKETVVKYTENKDIEGDASIVKEIAPVESNKSELQETVSETTKLEKVEEELNLFQPKTGEIRPQNKQSKLYIEESETITPKQKTQEKPHSENHIIAEKFSESSHSIVDNLEKNNESYTLFSKISKEQSSDLKKAIGINDRFLFTNELFMGNISAYNQFIDEVDKFDDGLKAWEYIEQVKAKKSWDSASSSYKRLFEIIQKKFLAD